MGGDEFTVIITDAKHDSDIVTVASKIISEISQVVSIGEQDVYVGASIGISMYPKDGHDVITTLIRPCIKPKKAEGTSFAFSPTKWIRKINYV